MSFHEYRFLSNYLDYLCPLNHLNLYFFMLSLFKANRLIHGVFFPYRRASTTFGFSEFSTTPSDDAGERLSTQSNQHSPETPKSNQSLPIITKKNKSDKKASSSGKKTEKKQIKLSPIAQKAVLASLAIKTILNAKPPKSIQDTLRDQVLQKLKAFTEGKEFDFTENHKDEIIDIFDEGTRNINLNVFNQLKVSEAILPTQKIIFFPTYRVTTRIYDIILLGNRKPYAIIGSYGIGKTFAVMFYSILAKYINHLKYSSTAYWIPSRERENYKEEYEMLKKKQLIIDVKKCWYWSIDKDLMDNLKWVKKIILQQIDQLSLPLEKRRQLQTATSLNDLIFKLNRILIDPQQTNQEQNIGISTKTHSLAIVDQINVLTAFYRDLNTKINNKSFDISLILQQRKKGKQLVMMTKAFLDLGLHTFVNSSIHLQKDILLGQNYKDSQRFSLYRQGYPTIEEIKYTQQMKKIQTKIQFCQQFLFLLQLQCYSDVSKKNFQIFKKIFSLENFMVQDYYRFLFIRQYFDDKQIKRYFMQNFNTNQMTQEKIMEFISIISVQFYEHCIKKASIRLKDYLDKGLDGKVKKYKSLFVKSVYFQATKLLNSDKKASLFIKDTKFRNIIDEFFTNDQHKPTLQDVQNLLKSKDWNDELFPYRYERGTIFFDWPAQEFIKMAYPVLFDIPQYIENKILSNEQLSDIQSSSSLAGIVGERYLRDVISCCNGVIFKTDQMKQVKFEIVDNGTFLIFNQLPSMNKEQIVSYDKKQGQLRKVVIKRSLQRNLGQALSKAKIQQNKAIYLLPSIIQEGAKFQTFNEQSQVIDFMFVVYRSNQDIFDLTTVDMTISKYKVGQKTQKASYFFKKLLRKVKTYKNLDQLNYSQSDLKLEKQRLHLLARHSRTEYVQDETVDENKYRINHVILCPLKACKSPYVIAKDLLTINYFPIQHVAFEGSYQNESAYNKFKEALMGIEAKWWN